MQIFNKTKTTLLLLAAMLVAGVAFAEAAKKLSTIWEGNKVFTEWDIIELTGNDVKAGDKLIITAKNNSKQNVYVQPTKRINGKRTAAQSIRFSDVTAGQTIDLTMSSKPSKVK